MRDGIHGKLLAETVPAQTLLVRSHHGPNLSLTLESMLLLARSFNSCRKTLPLSLTELRGLGR
jgi:hypothetical protein